MPYSNIPAQSKLFLQYQSDAAMLSRFYPNFASSDADLKAFADEMLSSYSTDRASVCDALLAINRDLGCDGSTQTSIEYLRKSDTVAVLTGQQTGLFGGPLYTIYKALSAIKQAEKLTSDGVKAVAIFWAATEDHDLDEIAATRAISSDGEPFESVYRPAKYVTDAPVGGLLLDDGIRDAIGYLFERLPQTQYSQELAVQLAADWVPGSGIGRAFLRQMARLLSGMGLIFCDPQDLTLKRLSAPILAAAIEQSDTIVAGLTQRNSELISAGYHAQVLVESDHVPLFWHTADGVRTAIRRAGDSMFRAKADKRKFTRDELRDIATTEPDRLSPAVLLRPVVQDYLFPTVCYFGGGAEIAYFAQNSAVYQALGRPVTPIFHRQSFTIVESKNRRTLEKYGLSFADLFAGRESVATRVVENFVGTDGAHLFADVEEKINAELRRLDEYFASTDVSLLENLAKRRRKVLYHIAALRRKAYNSELRRGGDAERRLKGLFDQLLPHGQLQERSINILTFLNSHGPTFIGQLCDLVDLDDRGHRIIYL